MNGTATRADLPAALLVVALAAFLAHFSLYQAFGLYEDDYWAIAPHLAARPADLWPIFVRTFSDWPQGRPLNHFLPPMLAVVGGRLGGLEGAYLLAFVWLTLNATLVLLIVRRLVGLPAAVVAALAYTLFPADTTKPLLVHAAHVQGAMTFLLLGKGLWLRGGTARAASYPIAALALLAYELAWLPFLAAPLLVRTLDRRELAVNWLRHGLGCGATLALVIAVRSAHGESRLAAVAGDMGEAVRKMVTSLWLGPATSGTSLLRAVPEGWHDADSGGLASAAVVATAFALLLIKLGSAHPKSAQTIVAKTLRDGSPEVALQWWRLLLVGLICWSGSYGLTLTNYPPTQTAGRLTSTHVSAAWGVALVIAALFEGLRRGARSPRLATLLFAGLLGAWTLYHHGIQRQFVDSRSKQSVYWRQLLELTPDVGPGWSVVVQGRPVPSPPAILVNSWADPLVLRALRPSAGTPIAYAHLGHIGAFIQLRQRGDSLEWNPDFWAGGFLPIDPSRLALLHDEGGVLSRVSELTTGAGTLRTTAPIPSPSFTWPAAGPVTEMLFGS